jgi:hypothetical protein
VRNLNVLAAVEMVHWLLAQMMAAAAVVEAHIQEQIPFLSQLGKPFFILLGQPQR